MTRPWVVQIDTCYRMRVAAVSANRRLYLRLTEEQIEHTTERMFLVISLSAFVIAFVLLVAFAGVLAMEMATRVL